MVHIHKVPVGIVWPAVATAEAVLASASGMTMGTLVLVGGTPTRCAGAAAWALLVCTALRVALDWLPAGVAVVSKAVGA